ncbi:MAG: zinc ribbon domain-containing protein [Bacteroidetes bacterium]|nr:zinc ribbon domain-containing protein [Bacteroidota bacterium]
MDATINPADGTALCNSCFNKVGPDDQFCNNCGYPLKGSQQEQNSFKTRHIVNTIDLVDYKKKLRNAENTLYYLAGLFALWGIILFFMHKDEEDVLAYCIPNFVLAVVFLLLGAYTKKKPLICLISGFSLYVIVQVLLAINDPSSLVSGIFVKIIIIGFLVRGIKSAVETDRIRKESNLV